jgi:hypothetical protein
VLVDDLLSGVDNLYSFQKAGVELAEVFGQAWERVRGKEEGGRKEGVTIEIKRKKRNFMRSNRSHISKSVLHSPIGNSKLKLDLSKYNFDNLPKLDRTILRKL